MPTLACRGRCADNVQHTSAGPAVAALQVCSCLQTCWFLQVAVKAAQQLPPCLQHCVLMALVQAAQLRDPAARSSHNRSRNKDSSGALQGPLPALPAPVAAACLRRVAGQVQFTSSSLAACVEMCCNEQPSAEQALQHSTLCLLLAAMCSLRGSTLPQHAGAVLAAAAHSSSQHLQQQPRQQDCESLPASELQLAWLQLQVWATQRTLAAGAVDTHNKVDVCHSTPQHTHVAHTEKLMPTPICVHRSCRRL